MTRLLVLAATMALLLASTLASPAAADYSSNPAAVINCSHQGNTTSCWIDAPIDTGSSVMIVLDSGTTTAAALGGPQNFSVTSLIAPGTTAVVSFVVSGVTYSAVEIINNIVVPTATPVVTPAPTTVPGTVTPINPSIPANPGPLAVSGSDSRYLIAGGLAMILSGVLLTQRRPDRDEAQNNS